MASSGSVMLIIELESIETAGPVGPGMAWGNGMAVKLVGTVEKPAGAVKPVGGRWEKKR